MPATKRSLDELNKLGDDIDSRHVQPSLRPEDHGKFVAIDVDSGEFALDNDDNAAISRLRSRKPEADMWLMRAGYPTGLPAAVGSESLISFAPPLGIQIGYRGSSRRVS